MKLLYFILFTSLNQFLFSQEIEDANIEKLLTREFLVGINLNTSGWGIFGEFNQQKTYKYKKSYGFLITNIRHPKEYKILGTGNIRGYYYGKLNSFVTLKTYYGGNVLLFQSKRENGIEIQFKYKIGTSIGFIKPVYLEIDKIVGNSMIHTSEKYNPESHYPGIIYSRSSWYKGIKEGNFNVGFASKMGLDFNFSSERSSLTGGEVGVLLDYYPFKEILIMNNSQNYKGFLSLYLQLNIGNRF